jgi:hypothetical protein
MALFRFHYQRKDNEKAVDEEAISQEEDESLNSRKKPSSLI